MKTEHQELSIKYAIIPDRKDLNQTDKELLDAAIIATERAYAPYSTFHVGAAILLDNGKIICGTNQENAAFPSGLCAERVAAFSAGSNYPDIRMHTIAIAAKNPDDSITSISPCGCCRQVLLEYEINQSHPIKVILTGDDPSVLLFNSIRDLLPLYFNSEQLPSTKTF